MTDSKLPNIIFLDFDGVLCNPRACLAVGDTGCYSYLDPIACQLIKRLCTEHNCRLVISSSWRLLYDLYAIQGILNAACAGLGSLMYTTEKWRTVSSDDGYRGREIKEWVDKYSTEFNRFVIIDDDSDMEPLMESFVKTDAYDGIGFMDYMKAKKILTGNVEEVE